MSPVELATLSLLDPDQGVCPSGHPCRIGDAVGERVCAQGEYKGHSLICWEITSDEIEVAALAGAEPVSVAWARSFVEDRDLD
jgi:hypothetical protein